MNIKRFWVRKILGRIYDQDEIFNNEIQTKDMNKAELGLVIDMLYTILHENQENIKTAFRFIGEMPSQCDKCNYENDICFKCENEGIIKHNQLCKWVEND